jgi:PAS domain S-box-containing protein
LEWIVSSQALHAPGEQLFRYLFEQASLGIAVEDLEGKILLANPALCAMLGYEANELSQMSCSEFSNPEDSAGDWNLFQQLRAGSIDHYSLEKRYVRKDGVRVWGRLNVSLLKASDGGTPLVFAFVEDITARKQSDEALSRLSRKLIMAQDEERSRIARDLHDDIGQRISLMAAELEQLQEDPAQADHRAQELRRKVRELSHDVQALSHDLHSTKLEYLGVGTAMRSWCQEFSERQKVEVEFKSHDVLGALPPEISMCLFRVLQEGLHNAAKHSGVKRMEVQLWGEAGEVQLAVRDSGKGFDLDAALRGTGLGLISMQERVRLVGGTIAIRSQPMGGGNTIHVRIPLLPPAMAERAAG